jgi:hypothetical protein
MAGAEATNSAAKYALEATDKRAAEIASQATMVAAQTQGAAQIQIDLLREQATATWSAFAVQQAAAQATQAAQDRGATLTQNAANWQSTATQGAISSATAWPATEVAVTNQLNEIKRQEAEAAQRAYWRSWVIPLQTLAYPLMVLALCGLSIAGLVYGFMIVAPASVRKINSFRHGQRDELVILLPVKGGGAIAFMPDRMFAPGVHIGANGDMTQIGLAPNNDLQMRVTSQAQAADLAAALPPGHVPPALPAAQHAPQIEIIDVPGPHVDGWLSEVEEKLLTSGGQHE